MDIGLHRFQSHVGSPTEPLDALVSRLVDELAPGGSDDDIALLGVRWEFTYAVAATAATSGTRGERGRGRSGWVSPRSSREPINRVSRRSWWSARSTSRRAAPFADRLAELIRDARSPAIVDLSGVTFFDSSGINVLVRASASAEAAGVDLILQAPSRQVVTVLNLTGLGDHFQTRGAAS